jgi:ABC-type bacteriocin/lantibiotic exporter with double-glycine peptidase domain
MTAVAAAEVFSLILLSFLIVNINSLDETILSFESLNSFFQNYHFLNERLYIVIALAIISYAIISSFLIFYTLKNVTIASQVIGSKIKLNLIQKFLEIEWSAILNSRNSENISRIINDGNELGTLINFLLHLFCKLVIAILIISMLAIYNLLLTIFISIVLISTYLIIFFYFRPLVDDLSKKASSAKDKTVQIVSNLFGSMKEIIIYGNQKDILDSFIAANEQHAHAMGENYFLAQAPRTLIDTMLIILLASASILINSISLNSIEFFTSFAVFGIAALKLLPAFQGIFNFTHEINMRMPYLINTVKIFSDDELLESGSKNKFKEIDDIEKIECKNITFRYQSSNQDALKNINLSIKKGEKIAIIGPSGAGKSTLIDILLGLLNPNSGSININDINLKDINKENYRSLFSYVPQKLYLLEDSLKRNILFGMDPKSKSIDLDETVGMSQITELVDGLPNGLETIVEDGNASFSGGQKQCVGIARAFIRKRNMLILDESTNAMDADLEDIIFANIKKSTFKTVILITHKLRLLRQADKIIVMKDRSIESIGTFDELLKQNAFVQQMSQSANTQVE